MLLSWSVCRRTAAEQPRRRRLRGGNVPFHDQQKSSTHWIRTWRRCYVSTPSWCRWSGVRRRHRGHQSTSDRRRRSPSSRPNHYSRHHTQVSCTLISGQVKRSVGYVCLSVCVCFRTITLEENGLWHRYLARRFVMSLWRSSWKVMVKVQSHRMKQQQQHRLVQSAVSKRRTCTLLAASGEWD